MPLTSPFAVKQIYRLVLLCLALVPLCAANDWKYEESHDEVRDFAAGGYLHVRMSVGDMHITRGDSTKIKLHYTIKSSHESSLKDARVEFDVRGKDATIEFHGPTTGNTAFDVELEVPATINVDVHQKVGDMTVDSVEGDKDLSLGVGDIRVLAENGGYRLLNASTGIGDVHADGYGESRGWLGKSLKYHGDGKYELRAHVGVGDIHLEK